MGNHIITYSRTYSGYSSYPAVPSRRGTRLVECRTAERTESFEGLMAKQFKVERALFIHTRELPQRALEEYILGRLKAKG